MLDAAGYVAPQADRRTRGIDAVVLHPLWGTAVFFAVMFCFFQVVFTVAAPLQDRVGRVLGWLGGLVGEHIDNYVVRGLLGQGLIGGVGTVLQFIPQIVLLFLLIALLENVGYMARAAFLMDRVMAATGLEGRAFVAMLSSFACAIPGIMATRTLPSSRDRIATIITAPLMTCSARLPVFALLVGLLVSPQIHWWGLSAQGVVMFLLYLCGGTAALIAASVFKSTILRSDILPFTMEFPLPLSVAQEPAHRDVGFGEVVLAQGGNHHPGHVGGAVGAAQPAGPGGGDRAHVADAGQRVCDGP
ncbi:hypothetical protein NIIDMKKI_71540 [Mycobacterium kansasii]|uniref:Nucleoside transporter/FeoB GTPase Gate domain-containing protein n=1 Tax=Mycobacterium kansasii TaxID=1768 RepID=A0A7G1IT37_MYCKA|nr:hypothetical protein NIIDMKKI_71540 [Mycobacterium kansasii]